MKIDIKLEQVFIEEKGCHLLLNAEINSVPLRLVLDTGASRTVVDSEFLKRITNADALCPEVEKSVGVGSNQLESYLMDVDELVIGILKINNYQMASMNLEHVKSSYKKLGYDTIEGVLGGDILSDYNAIINYKTHYLELSISD
jgi:hypothetical protein